MRHNGAVALTGKPGASHQMERRSRHMLIICMGGQGRWGRIYSRVNRGRQGWYRRMIGSHRPRLLGWPVRERVRRMERHISRRMDIPHLMRPCRPTNTRSRLSPIRQSTLSPTPCIILASIAVVFAPSHLLVARRSFIDAI